MADDRTPSKETRGPNICPTCGGRMERPGHMTCVVCLPCLRKAETPPLYPCDGCIQLKEKDRYKDKYCGNWRKCRRWAEWMLVTWHHINLRAAQLREEKKEAETDGNL